MKGYITNNKCYIFPQEAGQIPEVEASVFYVQQEDYAAWIEENESLADKISPYNYNVMTVNPKVWANHENDDLEPAGPVSPELAWSADSATAQIGETNTFPTLTNPHSVTVHYASRDTTKATIDASTGEITLVAEGDTTISAAFAGDDTYEAQTVIYTLTVQAAAPEYATLVCAADYSEILADIPESIIVNDYTHIYAQSGTTIYGAYEASAKDANDNDVNCYIGDDESVTIYPTTTSTVTLTLTPVNPTPEESDPN